MKKKSLFKRAVLFIFVLLVLFVAFQFVYPDVSELKTKNPEKTAFMSYREKEWEREGKEYRITQKWVPLRAISHYLVKAVLVSEDDKFWSHEGFDYEAMQKAIEKDIKAKKFKLGGSTISQQLAKNLYLSPSKNPLRKIREAIITWRMERELSKKRILELYLNVAEWGDRGIFGIEAAARKYYGKSAAALGPEESSRLASILPNPRKFNPLGNQKYVIHRSNLIYNIMVRRGIVVPEYEEVSEPADNTAEPVDSATELEKPPQPSVTEEAKPVQ
jgi:monofunctional glycosyltransferase